MGCCGLISFACAPFMLGSIFFARDADVVNAFCGGVTCLLAGVLALAAARAPRKVELVLDRSTSRIEATIGRLMGPVRRTIAFSEVAAVRTYYLWGPARVGVQLRLSSGELFAIFDGASFPRVKQEAAQLADRIAGFLGVPREGR